MNEPNYDKFRMQPERSMKLTSKVDKDWIHGVRHVLTFLDYVPHLNHEPTPHLAKERFFETCLSFRDLENVDPRNRKFSFSSDGNSEAEFLEAPAKELVKRDFISDDYGSAFSGLLHLPAVSISGGKLGIDSVNSHKSYYSSSFKIGELSYLFGGLVVDLNKSLKSLGIPLSTDLLNISVYCSTVLPPHMDKALITSPMFVPNKKIHICNPARSTINSMNQDMHEAKSTFDICAMTGTQILESQVFFCGGFRVITDKVDFDSQTNRWMIYKSIELNRDAFILDVKTFRFSHIKISSNTDFIYDGRLGFSICSSLVNAVESDKRVVLNLKSVITEPVSPEVQISSPNPVYPSSKYKYPDSTSTSPSQTVSVSTTPVSAKSPSSTKSINSVKSPTSSWSHSNSNRSVTSESVVEDASKQTFSSRNRSTNSTNNAKEKGTSSSHSSFVRDPSSNEEAKKSPSGSRASSSTTGHLLHSSSQREKQSSQPNLSRPPLEFPSISSSHSSARVLKIKEDKYAKGMSEKKSPDDSDAKSGHKFLLGIPGRLFHRSGKHGTGLSSLSSPSTSHVTRLKSLNGNSQSKETKDAAEKNDYVERADSLGRKSELAKTRIVGDSECSPTISNPVPVSPESNASINGTNMSSPTASNSQLEKLSLGSYQAEAKYEAYSRSVSQPSSAKDARSGSRGTEEVFFLRTSSSDGSLHRQSSVELKVDSELRPSLKLKTSIKREKTFEPIVEASNSEAGDECKKPISPEVSKSLILTVSVYIFGGFCAKRDAEGRQCFVAMNDLLKIELIVSDISTLQFHPEAFIVLVDQSTLIPERRGFFASVIVSTESTRNVLKAAYEKDPSKLNEPVGGFKHQRTASSVCQENKVCPEPSFDDKCLLVHGGVDENNTVYGNCFLYHFKRNTWIEFKTFSYDYFGIPKQPYEDENVEILRFDYQLKDPKFGEAELRACHHHAQIITEGDTEYLVFVGGFYNHYLRRFDSVPYSSNKIDISRLIRLLLTMTNSNLLRMPILNLLTQTWYLKRYFYEFSNHVSPKCAQVLDNDLLVNSNSYIVGGDILVSGKQIVICHGQVHVVPSRLADFDLIHEATGTPHILLGGQFAITFPGI